VRWVSINYPILLRVWAFFIGATFTHLYALSIRDRVLALFDSFFTVKFFIERIFVSIIILFLIIFIALIKFPLFLAQLEQLVDKSLCESSASTSFGVLRRDLHALFAKERTQTAANVSFFLLIV
jgi:hypothetical protein